MATHWISILGGETMPDTSGNCFPEPYTVKAPTSNWDRSVWIFNAPDADIALHGGFFVPKNYVSTPKAVIVWTSTATSGTCKWAFDYRAVGGDDSELLNQATAQQSVTLDDVAPTAAHRRLEVSTALTAGNFAVGDEVKFILWRKDSGDTMAAASILFRLLYEYTDS